MPSLKRRLSGAVVATLAVTLTLTGLALDSAFRASSEKLVEERLQARIYAVLAAADEDLDGELQVAEPPPDPRLVTPGSGLYARLSATPPGQSDQAIWRSPSLLGEQVRFPPPGAQGETRFGPATGTDGEPLFGAAFALTWELVNGESISVLVQIAEDRATYEAQAQSFRQSLLTWFTAAVVLIIAVQLVILGWGLTPLAQAAREVAAIRAGERARMDGDYVAELKPLTGSINRLIDANEQRVKRHRDALGNLAHTLKTPLAVVRSAMVGVEPELRSAVDEQVRRMDDAVAYHLKRAAAGGERALGVSTDVRATAQSIANALGKVHADKQLTFDLASVEASARFHGDQGDLMEILGNLLDNAAKWASTRVAMSARTTDDNELVIDVTDDGPGLDDAALARIVERGVRTDPDTPGHGIGLAVVHQLVCEVYGGTLEFGAGELGGLRARLALRGHPGVE
ncbi:MAG: ATP-binding protein [Pseudomonadota bacterium]